MSEIVTISRPQQVEETTGRTNVGCFELSAKEVKMPDEYSFLKPGARMPVAAGEIYEIYHWAKENGSIWRNTILVSDYGEFSGPMAFVKKTDGSILTSLESARKAKWLDEKGSLLLVIILVMLVWSGAFATYLYQAAEVGNEWHLIMIAVFGGGVYALYSKISQILNSVTSLKVNPIGVTAHKSFYPDD